MAEVLSQDQIDNLLDAMNNGEIDISKAETGKKEKVVKLYNFKSPNKFSKEQLRTINMLYEDFSRALSTYLSGYLRTMADIEVKSVDQMTYYEFCSSSSGPILFNVVDFSPLKGSIILELYGNTVFSLVDRILGGNGEAINIERNFSEIEILIMQGLIGRMLNILKDTWKNIIELKPKLDRMETNSQFIQIVSPNEVVIVVTLSISIGKTDGFINFCLPHVVIEPILPKLTATSWFSNNAEVKSKSYSDKLENKIKYSPIEIKAELGRTLISINDFLNLNVGDVIKLDNSINDDIIVKVDNKDKYYGKPGQKQNKYAVKITKFVERDEVVG